MPLGKRKSGTDPHKGKKTKKKKTYGPKNAPKSGRDPHGPSAPKKKKPLFMKKKK